MDDGKRTVLVAALSIYAELLAKNTAQLELEQGKGKGKATDDDVDLKAEIQSQIKLCGELSTQITGATSGKDIARTFEVAFPEPSERLEKSSEKPPKEKKIENGNSWEDTSFQGFYAPTTGFGPPASTSTPKPHHSYIIEDEPYINPFTGFPVIPETGFEAGPSNTLPPPLRTAPRPPMVPSRPLSRRSGSSSEPPVRPPPKPEHLRARPLVLPKPTLDLSPALPPQRPAPTPPPSSHFWNTLAPANVQPATSPPSPYHWEADIQDPKEGVPGHQEPDTKLSQKNRYLRYITTLASKTRRATGSMRSTTRTPLVYQPLSPSTSYLDNIPVEKRPSELPAELPAELPGSVVNFDPALSSLRRGSQESAPPAYDELSDIGRSFSLASNSSLPGSRMWSLSSAFSSRTSLSPTSPSTSSSPGPQYDSTQTSRRTSFVNLNSQLRKSSSRVLARPVATSLQKSISVSALPNITTGGKQRDNSSAVLFTPTENPFFVLGRDTPVAKTREGHLDRRQTTSTPSRTDLRNFADRQVTSDAMLARHLSLDDSQSNVRKQPSRLGRPFPTFASITHGRAQRMGSVPKLPFNPISNTP